MKKKLMHRVALGVFCLYMILSLGQSFGFSGERLAPDFALESIDQSTYRLADYRGRPVVLIFFTTWCPFCAQELPVLEEFYQESAVRDGLMVFAINVQEGVDTVRRMVEPLNITYPVLLDQTGRIATAYRMVALPTTYFIDPRGNLQDLVIGAANPMVLREKIHQILWYRGLDDAQLQEFIPMVTDLQVLDFRDEGENPYTDIPTLRYHEVRDLEVALSHFSPDNVYLLLTDEWQQSVTIAKEMALAGFSSIYYRIADDREG